VVAASAANGNRAYALGVAACLAGGVGLVAGSVAPVAFLTRPLSGVGVALGLLGVLSATGGRPRGPLFAVAGAVLSGLVLGVSLLAPSVLGPRYEASRLRSDYDPDAVRVVPLRLDPGGSEGLEHDGYADASRAAVQQGFIRVRVTGATLGPLSSREPKRKPTAQPYLSVGVRVQHLGHGPAVRFIHWGVTEERAVPPAAAEADGLRLPARLNWADLPVRPVLVQELWSGLAAETLLLFDPPTSPGTVRLELPAEAWGGRGAFRFLIPRSMITASDPTSR
jgi:hypothetical protein